MTSSGRYQSKLFNIFSRSLSQIAKLQPQLRRLKIGAVWGAQVLLYLARGLIQNGFGKQGFQELAAETGPIVSNDAIAKSQPPSIASSSDRPIQQTLLAVKIHLASSKNAITAPIQVLPAIQGVATQLTTRTLVLVTAQNDLLDLLSSQQQKLLYRRIIWEVVNYGWAMRLAQVARLLGRIKIRRVSFLPLTEPRLSLPGLRQVRQLRVPLKLGLAQIRASFSALARLAPRDLEVNPGDKGLPAKGRRVHFWLRFWQQPTPTDQAAAIPDELTIRALIRAALAYFLSPPWHLRRSTSPQMDSSNPKAFTLTGQPQFQGRDAQLGLIRNLPPRQAEPWLTFSDLFGVDSKLVIGAGVGSPTMVSQLAGATQTQPPPQPHPVVNGEWIDIETEAILTGYIKQPLEQVLEWLDRSIAWLEGIMARLRNRLHAHVTACINLIQRHWHR